jgi:hypothetical protein
MSAISIRIPKPANSTTGLTGLFRSFATALVQCRSSRVTALVVATTAIGLGDLYLTLTYLHGPGMSEGNPLARWIISMNSPWLLAAWKVMLLSLTGVILFVTRKSRSGEVAAWVCAGVMVWLAGQWTQYAEKAPSLTPVIEQIADGHDWVKFSPPEAQ